MKTDGVMKEAYLHLLLASFVIAGCTSYTARVAQINHTLDSLQTIFAPDQRTAVFNVEAAKDGQVIVLRGDVDRGEAKEAIMQAVQAYHGTRLIDSITVLPEAALEPNTLGIVDVSVTSLYAAPRYKSELVDQVLLGHPVRVLKEYHGWYYVKSEPELPYDKGYLGWVDCDNIVRFNASGFADYVGGRKLIVTSTYTSLRNSPSGGAVVSDAVMRDYLKPISTAGVVFKIQLPDGRIAYVASSDVEYYDQYMAAHPPTPDGIENTAEKFLGFPYLWGGTSTKGFDCSGFVKTVYGMNGINLPRDASEQVDIGTTVDTDSDFTNLRKGDLLFFGQDAGSGKQEKIVHVAIYLGDGYFIHSSGLVRISSLVKTDSAFDQYDVQRFVTAKRILLQQSPGVGN